MHHHKIGGFFLRVVVRASSGTVSTQTPRSTLIYFCVRSESDAKIKCQRNSFRARIRIRQSDLGSTFFNLRAPLLQRWLTSATALYIAIVLHQNHIPHSKIYQIPQVHVLITTTTLPPPPTPHNPPPHHHNHYTTPMYPPNILPRHRTPILRPLLRMGLTPKLPTPHPQLHPHPTHNPQPLLHHNRILASRHHPPNLDRRPLHQSN